MDKTKIFGGLIILFALGIVGTGIVAYCEQADLYKIYASPLLFDPAWSANFVSCSTRITKIYYSF